MSFLSIHFMIDFLARPLRLEEIYPFVPLWSLSQLPVCDRASPLFAGNAIYVFKLFVLYEVIAIITVVEFQVNSEGTQPYIYIYTNPGCSRSPGGNGRSSL